MQINEETVKNVRELALQHGLDEFLSEREMIEKLGVSQDHLAKLRKEDGLPAVQVGRSWWYSSSLCASWLLERLIGGQDLSPIG